MQPTCTVCGGPIALSKARSNTAYCSNRCRQQAYRNRTKEMPEARLCAGFFTPAPIDDLDPLAPSDNRLSMPHRVK